MGRASQKFDQQLFTLKLSELSRQMQIKSAAADRKAGVASRKTGGSFLVNLADGQLALLGEWLEGVDRICREVWQTQGETITTEFVREILVPKAMTLIGARVGVTKSCVDRIAVRTNRDPHAARHSLAMKVKRLKSEIANRYEIEARTLEHKKAHMTKPKLPAPIRPVNTARAVTQSAPKPTRMPSRPDDFPSDLWPKAIAILSELIQKFPNQKHLRELCEHAVPEITPLYCEAVETGKMTAGAVLDDRSGVEELLHLLLIANDPGDSSCGISNQAWEILQGAKTATWGKLAQAIAEVQQRTGVASEPTHAQNNRETTQTVEDKPEDHRKIVDAYIAEVLEKTGKRITRTAIWRKAGYKSRTEFERWQRQDLKRLNPSAADAINRVLREKPHLK